MTPEQIARWLIAGGLFIVAFLVFALALARIASIAMPSREPEPNTPTDAYRRFETYEAAQHRPSAEVRELLAATDPAALAAARLAAHDARMAAIRADAMPPIEEE